MSPFPHLFAGAALWCSSAAICQAAVILAADFDHSASSITQSGFSTFPSGVTSQVFAGVPEILSGSLTVSLPNGGSSRYRTGPTANSGSFTQVDLMRDLFTGLHPSANGTALTANYTLSITGLDANTAYSIRIYSLDVDNNPNSVASWYHSTATPAGTAGLQGTDVLLGTITNNTGAVVPANNNAFSVEGAVTSNAAGQLHFKLGDTAGTGIINGFVLSTIPEPGLTALTLAGLSSLGLRRRRR